MSRIDSILLLVGKLNYTWSNTESVLVYLMAYLMGTEKEAAILVFLTLNTTRARLDLVDRLAKMKSIDAATRAEVQAITSALRAESKIRNKYNHCIYSFDKDGELEGTQLMRIAEFGDDIRYGKMEELDDFEVSRIAASVVKIAEVNRAMWAFLAQRKIAA